MEGRKQAGTRRYTESTGVGVCADASIAFDGSEHERRDWKKCGKWYRFNDRV
jgi:hypothetical protein